MRTPFQSPSAVLGVLAVVIAASSPGVGVSAREQEKVAPPPPPVMISPVRPEDRIEYSAPPVIIPGPSQGQDVPLRDIEWSNPPRVYVSRDNVHEVGAAVTVNCAIAGDGGVTDCRAEGVPAWPELLASALDGQRHWRLAPQARRGVLPGRRVVFDVRFLSVAEFPGVPIIAAPPVAAAPLAPPMLERRSVVTNPSWGRSPVPEYPEQALAAGVQRGRVVVNCGIEPTGALSDCGIIEEVPAGAGFGVSALASAVKARLSPRSVSQAAPGARVNFTLRYLGPDAVPEPASPPARDRTGE